MDSEVCPVPCSADQADKESFTTVAGGKYVCAFHRNCYSYFGELIMKMRCIAQEHGYTLGSVGVMIYRIDITLTDNSDETIAELQFPLITISSFSDSSAKTSIVKPLQRISLPSLSARCRSVSGDIFT